MAKIRVLIVDDAVVVRRILTDVLSADPEIEVAGVAANGRIAVQKLSQINPDLVTLDVEMPDMDGLEALREIRKTHPKLPVIMFSTLTERGGAATLEALSAGASDYVTKPANVGSVSVAMQRIREELVPKIKGLCSRQLLPEGAPTLVPTNRVTPIPRTPTPTTHAPAVQRGPIEVLAIGCSTGGPNALAALLPSIPGNLPVPVVLVQHMPPLFTKLLADRLNEKCALRVTEAAPGMPLERGHVLVAPGDHHMVVTHRPTEGYRVALNQESPENSCRPAVDPLFRSVAAHFGGRSLAVVLTGMGQDGLRGSEHIKERGGYVIAQDEASSIVWGMPGFVAKAGLADKVLPLDQISQEIVRRVMETRAAA